MPKKLLQSEIALIYDFDSTLSPQAMQEYTVLPRLGIDGSRFWAEVAEETRRNNADQMLTWMRLMLEKAEQHKTHLGKEDLRRLAKGIKYFEGVSTWFSRISRYVVSRAPAYIKLNHYLISAGLQEILDGCSIRKHFKQVYASRYHFDHHGVAVFPDVLINDTMKTQFLFRINKGREKLNESINEHMPEFRRPVPFSNMIYIGDGLSDVPSMTVTKKNGGFAIAVHRPGDRKSIAVCQDLLKAERVDYYASADYRDGKPLQKYVHILLDLIIARIRHHHEVQKGKAKIA